MVVCVGLGFKVHKEGWGGKLLNPDITIKQAKFKKTNKQKKNTLLTKSKQ